MHKWGIEEQLELSISSPVLFMTTETCPSVLCYTSSCFSHGGGRHQICTFEKLKTIIKKHFIKDTAEYSFQNPTSAHLPLVMHRYEILGRLPRFADIDTFKKFLL